MNKQKTHICIVLFVMIITMFSLTSCANEHSILHGFLFEDKDLIRATDNIAEYLNEDGTKSVYINSGLIEKSKNQLEELNDSFFIANGSYTKKIFSETNTRISDINNAANYIDIFQENFREVSMVNHKNSFGQELKAMCYKDVFEGGGDVYFYPTVYGVNSEIIIKDKDSVAEYTFKISVPQVFPETSAPDYIILKNTDVDAQNLSMLYSPILTDSSGRWNYNNKVELIDKNDKGEYTVKFSPNEEFLNDPQTKYPVVMNQSFYIFHNSEPDTSAYSNTGDDARHYLSPFMLLGDNTSKGEGYTFIRFETLKDMDINPDDIISVKYHIRNLYDLPQKAIVGLYAVTSEWCSINTMWQSIPKYDELRVTHVEIDHAGDYEFDVTSLVKQMIASKGNEASTYSIDNGFFIKSETSGVDMLLASGDSGLYSPCLEICLKK